MKEIVKKHARIITLAAIAVIALLFLFWRLDRADILGDDGHYAFRSIGYVDYVASGVQTTPLQWFGFRPWWSYLSFHDHPPLFFFIQHLFFSLFGVSVFVSRLPSVFAALGSLAVLYFLVRKIAGEKAALFSLIALVFNNYFIWMGRIGLLESVFSFFFLLGILFLVQGLSEWRKLVIAGVFFGLALLSKYTFLIGFPGIAAYIFFHRREVLQKRAFFKAAGIFLAIVSPIVIYNAMMYVTRGHFDVQFSDLFRQGQEDWPILAARVGKGFQMKEVLMTLTDGFGIPYALMTLLAIGYVLKRFWRERGLQLLPVYVLFSYILGFSFLGGNSSWLGVTAPFTAAILGIAVQDLFVRLKGVWRFALAGLGSVILAYSGVYLVSTNHLINPLPSFFTSGIRIENLGYNQLDKEITKVLSNAKFDPVVQKNVRALWHEKINPGAIAFGEMRQGKEPFNDIIVLDSRTNWFSFVWLLERWRFYRAAPIILYEEFQTLLFDPDTENLLEQLGFDHIVFIRAGDAVREERAQKYPTDIETGIEITIPHLTDYKEIRDDKGRVAFYWYEAPLIPDE